jgi:hypothetical protein
MSLHIGPQLKLSRHSARHLKLILEKSGTLVSRTAQFLQDQRAEWSA